MTDFEINDSPFTFSDDSAPLNNEPLEFSGSVGFSDTLTNLTGHDNDFLSTDGTNLVWATFAASNGLTYDADNYSLTFGGTLTGNTSITGATYNMAWTDIGAFDISSISSDIDTSTTLEFGRNLTTTKKSVLFNATSMIVTDAEDSTGFIYAADYSTVGVTSDRWLPDYAAVKSYTDNKFTFENGLTDTADTITLGGSLTTHTTIDGATNTYNFSFSDLNNFNLAFDGSATITDSNATQVGLVYAGDYSSTFTDRSLIDKAYVDNKFTFENGLTDTSDTITLGGTLNSNTTIDGDTGTYDFNFSNLDQFTLGFDNTAIITDSNASPKGLQYNADYSGSFATHSLVDKSYVDSIAVSGITWKESVIEILNFTTNEPAAPTSGDRYINSATGNSSATTQAMTANYIYEWDGATWVETIPVDGDTLNVNIDSVTPTNDVGWHNYDGSVWTFIGGITAHNDTTSIQGGNATERYHLTAAQYTNVGNLDSMAYEAAADYYTDIQINGYLDDKVNLPIGSPTTNQLAVWVSGTTIEGATNLAYDGSSFDIGVAANFNYTGGSYSAVFNYDTQHIDGMWDVYGTSADSWVAYNGISNQMKFSIDNYIDSATFLFQGKYDASNYNSCMLLDPVGAASLYYNGVLKLATSGTGVTVTGILSTSGINATSNITTSAAITSSGALTVGGVSDLNGTVKIIDGAVGTPSLTFDSDENCGIYRESVDQWHLVANGASVVEINTLGISVTGDITATTINSISVANLVNKSQNESISGNWTFTNGLGSGIYWDFIPSGTDLLFQYSGTTKAKLDNSGNLYVAGDVYWNETF